MTDYVHGARIIVADDQPDVARTLCSPLRTAGAKLHFVRDGQSALEEIYKRTFDLIVVDMKMPPEEWGGLWLLQQLNNDGWRIPTLVLSGEGSKQQVIEALRLGATDWINKDSVGTELLSRCGRILHDGFEQSLELASVRLPTPLAFRFARYARTTDPEKQVLEGLHTLESVLRFASVLGLSNPTPIPLTEVTIKEITQPSMGTWFTLCTALSKAPGGCGEFTQLLSWLAPERADRQTVQDFIKLRNDIAHGRMTPTPAHRETLDLFLRCFAHRAVSSWRSTVAVPTSMVYDGSTYRLDIFTFAGAGQPSPDTINTKHPQVTGRVLLFTDQKYPFSLFPWLITQTAEHTGLLRCLQFDGLQRTKGSPDPATSLKYAKADDVGNISSATTHTGGTWQSLAPWFPNVTGVR